MKWPQIPRPWNPAYTETYDAMTEAERQNSFKIDLALLIVVLFVCATLGGCSRVDGGADTPTMAMESPVGTSPAPRDGLQYGRAIREAGGAPVVVDEGTGCQYLGLSGHGLTPRMAYSRDGRYVHVGCLVRDRAVEIE